MRVNEVQRVAERVASHLSIPQPVFNMLLGWATDYDQLFARKYARISNVDSVLEKVSQTGRLLLVGRGGGAKTVILHRIARQAAADGSVVVIADLKRWSTRDYDEWKELKSYGERVDFLLLRFGIEQIGVAELDSLPSQIPRYVLVDGLNEVRSDVGAEILDALDDFVRFGTSVSVVVSDRLVRRTLQNPSRWQLAAAFPLEEAEVKHRVIQQFGADKWRLLDDQARTLLSSPYFLNVYLAQGGVAETKAEELRAYFERHALTPAEVNVVARAAFQLYGEASRTFSLQRFEALAGGEIANKLLAAGALVRDGDLAYFDHHLKHDYLAARHVAFNEGLWNSETFGVITFHASSFDTIVLAMQQIGNGGAGDRFLRALYDWNIYGAGYALSEGAGSVSPEMSIVVHAMFAERRWDIIQHSYKAAEDILHLINSELSNSMLQAVDRHGLLELVAALHSEVVWFTHWKALFTSPSNVDATDGQVRLLADADSVMGWTSSNVLRRKRLIEDHQQTIRNLLADLDHPTTQWRAAHVLGKFPSNQNATALLQVLEQGSRRVRYGVVRSLVEMAAQAEGDLRSFIFAGLSRGARSVSEYKDVVDEFQRALVIRSEFAPPHWVHSAMPAIAAIQEASSNIVSREDWDRTLRLMIDRYGYA